MAEDKRKVRVEERLKIKIGEAKNLPGRGHGTPGPRDVFCALTLDQEEIFRTCVRERTLNPFFGEEFQFEIPRKFRFLSVYVYDRDKAERVIGKVAIKREELSLYNNKDHWFTLKNVDCDSEVQGKCQIDIQYTSNVENCTQDTITVSILECSDLTLKNGSCDPFAIVTMYYSNKKIDSKRTKVKKKTNSPKFDESFIFELPSSSRSGQNHERDSYNIENDNDIQFSQVTIALWHYSTVMSDNMFLGEVRITLPRQLGPQFNIHNVWYYLKPRSHENRTSYRSCTSINSTLKSTTNQQDLGSIRLKIHYQSDHVFPSCYYDSLRTILKQSINVEPITASAAYILGEIVPCKTDAAQPLVRILTHHEEIVPIIKSLAHYEISKVTDANTIFRGNTLVSKMMDEVMQLAGSRYLHNTLKHPLEVILSERKTCEIDSTRIKDQAQVDINLTNLKEYVEMVFKAITNSALECPVLMCELFHALRELASFRFPSNKEVRYSVISGFIFLRFFAPAILGPKLFDLTSANIDANTNRTLTLISKTIQSLGNLVSCKSVRAFGTEQHKEEYMARVLESFSTETYIQAMRQFLEIISSGTPPSSRNNNIQYTPVVLKEGIMVKRAQGRKRFGRKNFKQRYFRLTTQDLSYSKTKGKDPLYCIPLNEILAVEKLEEESFKMKNMFQIIQSQRVLYVQANNCVEEKEWIDILTKICQSNKNRLEKYHPSAFISGQWMCCRSNSESTPGCQEVTKRERLVMTLDPDRELQRIHSIIIQNMDNLEKLMREYEHTSARNASSPNTLYDTLITLREITFNLEREHRTYQRLLQRELKYGSKQAPIGDDNYLHLANRAKFDSSLRFNMEQSHRNPLEPSHCYNNST